MFVRCAPLEFRVPAGHGPFVHAREPQPCHPGLLVQERWQSFPGQIAVQGRQQPLLVAEGNDLPGQLGNGRAVSHESGQDGIAGRRPPALFSGCSDERGWLPQPQVPAIPGSLDELPDAGFQKCDATGASPSRSDPVPET